MSPSASSARRARPLPTPAGPQAKAGSMPIDAFALTARRVAGAVAAGHDALTVLSSSALELTAAEGVAVAGVEQGEFRVQAAAGSLVPMIGFRAPIADSLVQDVVAGGHGMLLYDAPEQPRLRPLFLAPFSPDHVAIAPVIVGTTPRAVMIAIGGSRRMLGESDLATLQRLADIAAITLGHATAAGTVTALMERHAVVLASAARLVASGGLIDAVLDGISKIAATELRAEGCSVFVLDSERRALELTHSTGVGSDVINAALARLWAMPAGRVILGGDPVYVPDLASAVSLLRPDDLVAFRSSGITSIALLPLTMDGARRGVLVLRFCSAQRFEAADRRILEDFAMQVAVAVQNARLAEAERTSRDRERELSQAVHQAEKLAAIGELVAGVAHELNNPLTSISTFAQLLLDDQLSPEQRESLGEIKREANRAASVIRDLLTFSRKTGPRLVSVDLNTIVQHTLRLRAYSLQTAGIDCRMELDPALPAIIGDDQRLQQVLLNLIVNAEYAMHGSDQRVLTLRTRREQRGGADLAIVEVQDTGTGMPPEVLQHLFEPFFTTKPAGVGTGLGLSVSYGIVQAHGGRIEVTTAPGTGTTFRVALPREAASLGDSAARSMATTSSSRSHAE